MPRRYLAQVLYFPRPNPDISRITSVLKSSFLRTLETMPILSGTVQLAPNDKQGGLCVGAPWNEVHEVFHVKTFTSPNLDYDNIRRKGFPKTLWDEHDIGSVYTSRPNSEGLQNPVLMAQVNFVPKGMILVVFLHHSFADGLGTVAIMDLWATFCRGEDGVEMLGGEMMDRRRLMVGEAASHLKDFLEYVDVSESSVEVKGRMSTSIFRSVATFTKKYPADRLSSPSTSSVTFPLAEPPKEVYTETFFFPRSKLAALKSAVSASVASRVPSSGNCKAPLYISTNDALSALIFTCITEARKSFKPIDTQQTIPFGLTVSGRRLLNPPLPANFIGNMSLFCYLDLPLHAVTPAIYNIASIAFQIRNRLSQLDEDYVRKLIGALGTVDDTSKVAPACRMSKDWPFMITPWTGQETYGIDWGKEIGSKCERVRIPKVSWPAFDGVNIIFPELKRDNDGVGEEEEAGLEVMVGLEKRVMGRLREMEEWNQWAQWRCS